MIGWLSRGRRKLFRVPPALLSAMPRQGKEGMVGRLSLLLFRSMPAILEEGVRRALSTDDDVTRGEGRKKEGTNQIWKRRSGKGASGKSGGRRRGRPCWRRRESCFILFWFLLSLLPPSLVLLSQRRPLLPFRPVRLYPQPQSVTACRRGRRRKGA